MDKYLSKIIESPLFYGLKEPELKKMMNCIGGTTRNYHKGEIIFLMNDEVRYIAVVLSGCVHMVKENSQGDKTLLSIIRAGEVFGESFACGDEQFAYTTFVAMENTVTLFMPFHKVMHACNTTCVFHHRMVENMVTMIANKNVRLMQKIYVSSQKTLRDKILAYMDLQKKIQKSDYIELNISRTILAEYLGVNRSALARELGQMKAEGILDYDKNSFHLKQI